MPKQRRLKIIGFGIGVALGLTLGINAAQASEPAGTGHMIVGLKKPATVPVIQNLRRKLPGRVLQVAPGGQWLLVQPRKGKTAADMKKASPLIAYVERETYMGLQVAQDKK